jgi:hypothetical protein
MAKTKADSAQDVAAQDQGAVDTNEGSIDAVATPPVYDVPPRLGETITVVVAEGHALINNETGSEFAAGVPTSQVVTITTLRRLADGDLVRV